MKRGQNTTTVRTDEEAWHAATFLSPFVLVLDGHALAERDERGKDEFHRYGTRTAAEGALEALPRAFRDAEIEEVPQP